MGDEDFGANEFSLEELEDLFKEDGQETPPVKEQEKNPPATQPTNDDKKNEGIEQTKAFAKRLSEVKIKEREAIAKTMGYNSYDEMIKEREAKLMEDKGLDPEQVAPIVDELVKQRIDNDPRMKELETLRRKQIEEFGKKELAEISKLTEGEVTKFEQLPKEVLELWKSKGSLKAAYLAVKGEELLLKARSANSKGSTSHLAQPNGSTAGNNGTRLLTEKEKQMYKFFNPGISEEELNKKTTKI